MGWLLFLLWFISVQAEVVSLPSNATIQIQSTGFHIEGSTLTGQKLVPVAGSLIQSTTVQLKVRYAPRTAGALLTITSPLMFPALPLKSSQAIPLT